MIIKIIMVPKYSFISTRLVKLNSLNINGFIVFQTTTDNKRTVLFNILII
jgi:hypothetical protein